MTSSYARASKLMARPQRKKKTTKNAAATTTSHLPGRPLSTTQRRKSGATTSRRQNQSSDNNSTMSFSRLQGGGTNHNNTMTVHHPYHKHGLSVASNSQPSSVSFHSSAASSQENGYFDIPMSQLTEQSYTNDSSAVSTAHNSLGPELHQYSQASTSNNSTSRSSSSVYSRGQGASLYTMATGQPSGFDGNMNPPPPAQAASSTPRATSRRAWMASGATSVLSKSTHLYNSRTVQAPMLAPSAKLAPVPSPRNEPSDNATKNLDRSAADAKLQDVATTDEKQTNEKPNSLITDHFKKIGTADDKENQQNDVFAEREQRLIQKQKDLEKLFANKQKGFEALVSDIETKQQSLKKLALDVETKMRGFDDRVEEETTTALARLNSAATDGVDKINRGVESFTKLVSNAKESFQSMFLQPMAQKLLPSSSTVYSQSLARSDSTQRDTTVTTSREDCQDSLDECDDSSPSLPVPSTVHVKTSKRSSSSKKKIVTKAKPSAATRASKRLLNKKVKATTPKRVTARNSKTSCVTPSTKTTSRTAPPVSITVTRRTSTKKRIGATSTPAVAESTRPKKRLSSETTEDMATQQRGRKKARKASANKHVSSPETVSDTQTSSQSSSFVSPALQEMSKRRKQQSKGRRAYGSRGSGKRVVSTCLDDCFDFISQANY